MKKNDQAITIRLNELFTGDNPAIKKLPLGVNDKYAVFSDLLIALRSFLSSGALHPLSVLEMVAHRRGSSGSRWR